MANEEGPSARWQTLGSSTNAANPPAATVRISVVFDASPRLEGRVAAAANRQEIEHLADNTCSFSTHVVVPATVGSLGGECAPHLGVCALALVLHAA